MALNLLLEALDPSVNFELSVKPTFKVQLMQTAETNAYQVSAEGVDGDNVETGPILDLVCTVDDPTLADVFPDPAQQGRFYITPVVQSAPRSTPLSVVATLTDPATGMSINTPALSWAPGAATAISPVISIVPIPTEPVQVLTFIDVQPNPATVSLASGGEQFSAVALDATSQPMNPQPAFTWSLENAGSPNSISESGFYTPTIGVGVDTVIAACPNPVGGFLAGSAAVNLTP